MAGARVEITRDTATPALKRLLAQMQGPGRDLLLEHIGEYLLGSTRDRAKQQVDPGGTKWAALSPGYKRWKDKQRPGVPILKFDDHMLGDQLSWQRDGADLLVGTNAPYGARHQFGGTFQHAARSTRLSFAKDRPNGMKVFARRGTKPESEKWAKVEAYSVTTPARPFLGVSATDRERMTEIATDHLGEAFEGG